MHTYTPPTLTVDTVVFRLVDNQLEVLLIRRGREPFAGMWALPGGYCAAGETTEQAMSRVLAGKAGIITSRLEHVEQLYTFDTVARDPRGHAVSVTYMGLGRQIEPESSAATQEPAFFSVQDLPELAYDHEAIIRYAIDRLRSKLTYTNVIWALLPTMFTLTELQTAYEAILGRPLDKRNFRKKFHALDLLAATENMRKQGASRPARLYTFAHQKLESLDKSFD